MNPKPGPSRRGSRRPARPPRRSGGGGKSKGPAPEPLHPTENPPEVESFAEWDLGDEIQACIAGMGITQPTPIQALAIGPVLAGKDVIAKAETGTGKTLAFGAPMMARIDPARASVLGLVLCPTRELSEQVHNVLAELGRARGVKTALIVGGEPMHPQVEALQAGGQVVVGTPGRVLDLMNQGFLGFPWTEYAVLDEADKMLEIGFIDDVKKILAATPDERQTLHFSATFPNEVLALARATTREPVEIATAAGLSTVDSISQYFLEVSEDERPRALARLIDKSGKDDVFLVFCDRRTDVDRLFRRLERERFSTKALHGGYDQASRFRVMSAFRTGEVKALLATDVASRGLDVDHVTHVVNFGVPREAADYTHRIGRTGRAGRKGTAITLVTPIDRRRWNALLSNLTWEVEPWGSPAGGRPRSRRPDRDEKPRESSSSSEPRGRGGRSRSGSKGREPRRRASQDQAPPERAAQQNEGSAGRGRGEPAANPQPRPQPKPQADQPRKRRPRRKGAGPGGFGAGVD